MAPPRLLSIGLLRAEELAEEQIKAVVEIVSYTTLVSLLLKSIGHTDPPSLEQWAGSTEESEAHLWRLASSGTLSHPGV